MTLTLTIPTATEYVDRTLATASWWDKYTIRPGIYEVEVVTIDGHPVPADSPRAYYVRARIDTNTKERAATALEAMGLSISDAIRLLMLRIADEHRLPFDVKVPNATTKKAIAELEAGKGKKFTSVDDLMADLHADD